MVKMTYVLGYRLIPSPSCRQILFNRTFQTHCIREVLHPKIGKKAFSSNLILIIICLTLLMNNEYENQRLSSHAHYDQNKKLLINIQCQPFVCGLPFISLPLSKFGQNNPFVCGLAWISLKFWRLSDFGVKRAGLVNWNGRSQPIMGRRLLAFVFK